MEHNIHRGVLDRPEALRLFASQFGVATMRQLVDHRRARADARPRPATRGHRRGASRGRRARRASRRRFASGRWPPSCSAGGDSFLERADRRAPLRSAGDAEAADRTGDQHARARACCRTGCGRRSVRGSIGRDVVRARRRVAYRHTAEDAARYLAARLQRRRFERAAEDAWHLRLSRPSRPPQYLERVAARGRSGVSSDPPLARSHVAVRSRASQSGLEIDVLEPQSQQGCRSRCGSIR